MDILKQGVSYDFRVIGVNDYGYGSPSQPSPSISGQFKASRLRFSLGRYIKCLNYSNDKCISSRLAQKVAPFYEEWWFLVVVALVGLIFILLLVFILIIRGQSKKYAKKSDSGMINMSVCLFVYIYLLCVCMSFFFCIFLWLFIC